MATLSLTRSGGLNLTGRVRDDSGQIDCGLGCGSDSGTYPVGTTVTLTAEPGLIVFNGWSGACSGTGLSCTVVMTGNKSVTATFSLLVILTHAAEPPPAQWASRLDAPGATGIVTVKGAGTAAVGRAPAMIEIEEGSLEIRVEGVLANGSGPGTWRFERYAGSGPPVRLKVLEGQVALVTPDAIVFRLRGQPGERVGFAIVRLP